MSKIFGMIYLIYVLLLTGNYALQATSTTTSLKPTTDNIYQTSQSTEEATDSTDMSADITTPNETSDSTDESNWTEATQTSGPSLTNDDAIESSTKSDQTTIQSVLTRKFIPTTTIDIMKLLKPDPVKIPYSKKPTNENRSNKILSPSHVERTSTRWAMRTNSEADYFHPVCEQPKVRGTGWLTISFWYYNKYNKTCEWFNYSGKEGNGNRFKSRINCELSCVTPINNICLRKDIVRCQDDWLKCELLPDTKCQNESRKAGKSEHMVCPPPQPMCVKIGSRDDFTYKEIPTYLTHRNLVPKECKQIRDIGTCPGKKRRKLFYSYNPIVNMCSGFMFTGCGGNSNRFINMQQCMNHCAY